MKDGLCWYFKFYLFVLCSQPHSQVGHFLNAVVL
jgi:hypothetical protein